MTKGRAAVVGTVCIGILGTLAACSAVLGITDYTYPGPDGGGGSSSGGEDATGDTGGSSGGKEGGVKDGQAIPLDCATEDGAAGALNCPCSGTVGCNGYAQPTQLVCTSTPDGSVWAAASGMGCGTGQNCDTSAANAGKCEPIVADCMNAQPNEKICVGQNVIQCGLDLVSESTLATCTGQACVSGACTGTCEPSATQCTAGQTSQTCDTNGKWDASTACVEQCITTPIGDAGIPDGGDAGPTASACGNFPSCQATGSPAARQGGADNSCGDNLDVDGGDLEGGEGGTAGNVDCCTSTSVTGNSASNLFYRGYDNITVGNNQKSAPAILSNFRLDQYEVTVGRFRQFVNAVEAGWQPQQDQGKHAYLNGGAGLASVGGDAGGNELGYPSGQSLPTSQATWSSNLGCFQGTWTDQSTTAGENLPINCVTWYEAYAFCIWDGGFLPSEAEWDYAAAGGPAPAPPSSSFGITGQRVYPWANNVGPENDAGTGVVGAPNNIDCTFANFTPSGSSACVGTPSAVGSYSPQGDGKFGQADLAGNVSEWILDSTASTPSGYLGNLSGNVCQDCANTSSALPNRIARGGSFNILQSALYASYRLSYPPTSRDGTVGVRCARAP